MHTANVKWTVMEGLALGKSSSASHETARCGGDRRAPSGDSANHEGDSLDNGGRNWAGSSFEREG